MQYASGGHTNALVPLYAKGERAPHFLRLLDGRDRQAGHIWDCRRGYYVDNTDIYEVTWKWMVAP